MALFTSRFLHHLMRHYRQSHAVQRIDWLDNLKAIAVIWIFVNHLTERIFGFPYIANPSINWPPLSERIMQLQPIQGQGILTPFINAFRYIGWAGDEGVQLFLMASGFGLTYAMLHRDWDGVTGLKSYYSRRFGRIYPLWWTVHVIFIITWIISGWGLSLGDPRTYLSLAGIRITPSQLYYFSPAWWYVGLIIQLYLIFPIIYRACENFGWTKSLLAIISGSILARGAGLILFRDYLDAWQRGAFFITRLPEFAFGIYLAYWYFRDKQKIQKFLFSSQSLAFALGIYAIGTMLSLTLLGMSIAPILLCAASFAIVFRFISHRTTSQAREQPFLSWIGRHSYSIFLMHHPMILLFLPQSFGLEKGLFLRILSILVMTIAGAIGIEFLANSSITLLRRLRVRIGGFRTALIFGGVIALVGALVLGAEITIRIINPQEVLGWGERASLEVSDDFGWRLIPSRKTSLRWEGYDYEVTANELGFPGPAYPAEREQSSLRILVTGDAFTSAEGVNTEDAWPRLLEDNLAVRLPDQTVEVMNFAITGYGPNQYRKVIERFVPEYRPDWIVVAMFINDLYDVQQSEAAFRASIGFQLPPQENWRSYITLEHIRKFLRLQVAEPLKELVLNEPRQHGYFLGNFQAFEISELETLKKGQVLITDFIKTINEIANRNDAELMVLLIPSSIQVCKPSELSYFPVSVDLDDPQMYDINQPNKLLHAAFYKGGVTFIDLLEVFKLSPSVCPYQKGNMHWTEQGHMQVAQYLVGIFEDLCSSGCSQ